MNTSEERVVLLAAGVQMAVVGDFMMLLPLGPDVARGLSLENSALGYMTAVYSMAAAGAGVGMARILDRLDHRIALAAAMLGLSLSVLACTVATGFVALMMARAAAGLFAGPAAALGQAVVADGVPQGRRGRATALVMVANALVGIVGVPAGLSLAESCGWRAPLWVVGGLGLLVTAAALSLLPRETRPLGSAARPSQSALSLLWHPQVRLCASMTFAAIAASFLLNPHLSAFVQHNLSVPRSALPGLYAVSGGAALVSMPITGWLVDRHGALPVVLASTAGFVAVVVPYLVLADTRLPVLPGFVGLVVCLSSRNVAVRALTLKSAVQDERAGMFSLLTAVGHLAGMGGALCSAWLLADSTSGALVGMSTVSLVAIGLSVLVLLNVYRIDALDRSMRS